MRRPDQPHAHHSTRTWSESVWSELDDYDSAVDFRTGPDVDLGIVPSVGPYTPLEVEQMHAEGETSWAVLLLASVPIVLGLWAFIVLVGA